MQRQSGMGPVFEALKSTRLFFGFASLVKNLLPWSVTLLWLRESFHVHIFYCFKMHQDIMKVLYVADKVVYSRNLNKAISDHWV